MPASLTPAIIGYEPKMFDVGIVGVGSVGSMALWQLASRQRKVIGFEQFTIGHDRGAAIGGCRLLRVISPKGEEYVSLMQESVQTWRELERQTGRRLLTENGVVTIGRKDLPAVAGLLDMIATFDLDAEVMENAGDRFPTMKVSSDEIAILDRAGGALNSELSVVSAVRRAKELGAQVRSRSRIVSIEPDQNGVWIRTDDDACRVERLIVTAGAWSGQLLGPKRSGLVSPRQMSLHRFPVLFDKPLGPGEPPPQVRLSDGAEFWIAPTENGAFVQATAQDENWPVASADAFDRRATFGASARVRDLIERHCMGVSADPVTSTVHLEGFSPDRSPIVGLLEDWPNVAVAIGFSGFGFGMAPAIGLALADLVCSGTTTRPISHMRPTRRSLRVPPASPNP